MDDHLDKIAEGFRILLGVVCVSILIGNTVDDLVEVSKLVFALTFIAGLGIVLFEAVEWVVRRMGK